MPAGSLHNFQVSKTHLCLKIFMKLQFNSWSLFYTQMSQQAPFLSALQPSHLATSWHTPQPRQSILIVCSNLLDKICPCTSSPGNWTACPEFFTGTNLPKTQYSPINKSISGLYAVVGQSAIHRFHLILLLNSLERPDRKFTNLLIFISLVPLNYQNLFKQHHLWYNKWKTCVPKKQSGSTEGEIHKRREGRKKKKQKKSSNQSHWSNLPNTVETWAGLDECSSPP